ncbi:MAG: allantoinase AllB [Clostridia bacterium]|nr:allantoinase AllB [Deltaproteobacteria bacterium]
MHRAIASKRVVFPDGIRPAILRIENEKIVAISNERPTGVHVVDFGDHVIMPGLVDTHVHINEPGRTEWEGFATGTRAAAAGGICTIVDMPLNCLPETTTVAALNAKREAAEGKCTVDWLQWGGAVADNQTHINALADAGVPGYKCFLLYPGCDGFTMIDQGELERSAPLIAATGLPLLVHAELQGPIDAAAPAVAGKDWRRYATYLASRPDEAELDAIAHMIDLCRRHAFRLHIVHVSTARALPLIEAAKAEGLPISAETCQHYLHFAAEEIADGATFLKCAPPIRSASNRELLWDGLRRGVLDMVVTDHSPCPPAMKHADNGRFDQAWGGINSLAVALSVVWTGASVRGFGLNEVARWMCAAPSALAGLSSRQGALAVGNDASYVVFDPETEWTVRESDLHTRHALSPYVGQRLRGVVRSTAVRGHTVIDDGQFEGPAIGIELRRVSPVALALWNSATADVAEELALVCCGSRAWTKALVAQRPFTTALSLYAAADEIWNRLLPGDWQQAFDAHPRIGEHKAAASAQSLALSSIEQSAVTDSEDTVKAAIAEGNRKYEQRFNRVFIVRATDRSPSEILEILERRLKNDAAQEMQQAAEQQREITRLRLQRWIEGN